MGVSLEVRFLKGNIRAGRGMEGSPKLLPSLASVVCFSWLDGMCYVDKRGHYSLNSLRHISTGSLKAFRRLESHDKNDKQ